MSDYPRFQGQMRWVNREVCVPGFPDDISRIDRVLQQAIVICPDCLEWQDVPTVEEE